MKIPKIFVFGLDRAGKTFITNYLVLRSIETVYKPTLGFNIQNFAIKDFGIQIWDAPGQKGFRSLWSKGYKDADLLMYVLDTADDERFEESREEFDKVMSNIKNQKLPILFCFNKMDLANAKANVEKAKKVFVSSLMNRNVRQVETSIYVTESLELLKEHFAELLTLTKFVK